MHIIVEGPDKSGKSTLIESMLRLTDEIKCCFRHTKIIHCKIPKTDNPANEYAKMIMKKQNIIFDRCLFGECIYGPLLRDKFTISKFQLKVLMRWLNKNRSIVVYAKTKNIKLNKKRFLESNKEIIDNKSHTKSIYMFDTLFKTHISKLTDNLLYFDAARPNSADSFILGNRFVAMVNSNFFIEQNTIQKKTPGYGNILGKYLIIGESLNKNNTWLGLPFDNGRCSHFLAVALEKAKIYEKDCYFVNADEIKDKYQFSIVHQNPVEFKTIIALGKKAHKIAEKYFESNHIAKLPHPQYVIRFKYKEQNLFINQLENLK